MKPAKFIPAEDSQLPLVLIHPGSGPTDRNGNSAMLGGSNDSLLQLAEVPAGRGVGSLRNAKRGIAANGAELEPILLDGVNHVLKPATGDLQAQIPSYRSPIPTVEPQVIDAVSTAALGVMEH